MDDDGRLDAVVVRGQFFAPGSDLVSEYIVVRGLGNGAFEPSAALTLSGLAGQVLLADFDEDGRLDAASLAREFNPSAHRIDIARNVTYPAGSPFVDLGHALRGSNGWPILYAEGSMDAGRPFTFHMLRGLSPAPFLPIVGVAELDAPFKGGVLVPVPVWTWPPVTVGPNHSGFISGTTPAGASGLVLYIQAWFADPEGPAGFAATTGLRIEFP